eukprot:520062-Pleurochrysis_carterae.AAC.1
MRRCRNPIPSLRRRKHGDYLNKTRPFAEPDICTRKSEAVDRRMAREHRHGAARRQKLDPQRAIARGNEEMKSAQLPCITCEFDASVTWTHANLPLMYGQVLLYSFSKTDSFLLVSLTISAC